MNVKGTVVEFLKRQRRHLEDLQEARFDRSEKELMQLLNDEYVKDSFPVPGPAIAILVWGFVILFPLLLLFDPSNQYANRVDVSSLITYYVPLVSTFVVFWLNQKILVPKLFFRKKYFKYLFANGLLIVLSLFCRECFSFMAERAPDQTWEYFFKNYSFSAQGHFTIWTFISFNIFLLMVCFCSILICMFSRQVTRAFVIRERNRANLEYELNFLKQQLSPHFLFNTLNNISSLITIDPKLAEKSMTKLSQLLRVTLYQTEDRFITIKEEMEILEKYADLEKLRHDDNFEFTFNKSVDDASRLIEPLLLMPLLENAMKHCVNPNGKSFAHVDVVTHDGELTVNIENSNYPRKSQNKANGLGLSTFKKRLDLLYKENYSYRTWVSEETYFCELKIKLK